MSSAPSNGSPSASGGQLSVLGSTIANLAKAGLQKQRWIIYTDAPLALARGFVEHHTVSGHCTIRRWRGQWWRWTGSRYEGISDEELQVEVYQFLPQLKLRTKDHSGRDAVDANGVPIENKLRPCRALVGEVVAALPSQGVLVHGDAPQWLDGRDALEPAATSLLPVANGLLDINSGKLLPPTPGFFATVASDVPFDPSAQAPEWHRFLASVWPSDRESIDVLGEMFGYLLTPNTSQQKIFAIVGPRRSGKGTIARVLTRLVGADSVAAPNLASLGERFGLQPLLDKSVAILGDARLSTRSDGVRITETLLAVSGEDAVTVDRKNYVAITAKLPTRFVVCANMPPEFGDASNALAGRFVVLRQRISFYGNEDLGLLDRLISELPGILNWALAGLARLRVRGHFIQPASGQGDVDTLADMASPVAAFIRDRCIIARGEQIEREALFKAWAKYCKDEDRFSVGTKTAFVRDLIAAEASITESRPRRGATSPRPRVLLGIALAAQGDTLEGAANELFASDEMPPDELLGPPDEDRGQHQHDGGQSGHECPDADGDDGPGQVPAGAWKESE